MCTNLLMLWYWWRVTACIYNTWRLKRNGRFKIVWLLEFHQQHSHTQLVVVHSFVKEQRFTDCYTLYCYHTYYRSSWSYAKQLLKSKPLAWLLSNDCYTLYCYHTYYRSSWSYAKTAVEKQNPLRDFCLPLYYTDIASTVHSFDKEQCIFILRLW